jgi:two-component system response regulator RegA
VTVQSRVLVVDDDETLCDVLAGSLARRGVAAETAFDGATALAAARRTNSDFIVLELRIAAENGLDLSPGLCAASAGVRIVLLTGDASIATAVEAIKRGAHYYLTKLT